jgi:hypothetical protein
MDFTHKAGQDSFFQYIFEIAVGILGLVERIAPLQLMERPIFRPLL